MDLKCECLYCGHIFLKRVYYMVEDPSELKITCEKVGCGSKQIKIVPHKKRDVYGYNYIPKDTRGKPDIY